MDLHGLVDTHGFVGGHVGMLECMCMRMHACGMYACICVYACVPSVYARMRAWVCACMCECMRAHRHVCMCAHVCVHASMCMHVCMRAWICVYVRPIYSLATRRMDVRIYACHYIHWRPVEWMCVYMRAIIFTGDRRRRENTVGFKEYFASLLRSFKLINLSLKYVM